MDSDHPLVSVVLCTYNAERFIEPTLTSVVNQSYSNMEILILDNNSCDNTVSKIKEFNDDRIRIFQKEENIGPYCGLNYLIERANGEYVAIQDHDDIWHEQKIKLQVDVLEQNSDYVGCGGQSMILYENKNKVAVKKESDADTVSSTVPHTTLIFRNDGYYYHTSIDYKTDIFFMEEILGQDGNLFLIGKPLHLSLVREDNDNLMFEWTNGFPSNVIRYFWKTGNWKRLSWGLLMTLLPVSVAKQLKRQLFNYEIKHIDYIYENEFTKTYGDYIHTYVI